MLLFLLVATVSVAFAKDAEIAKEPEAAESAYGHSYRDGLELIRDRNRQRQSDFYRDFGENEHDDNYRNQHHDDDHEVPGPVILRTPHPLAHDGHVDIEAQNRIIEDVFSPDYHQPTWVLDYRYLKTGGRDYVRGPGGQILILPRGVHSKEHKEFPDYDAYLEHLRLSRLSREQNHRHGDDNYGSHRYQDRAYGDGHGQTKWRKI